MKKIIFIAFAAILAGFAISCQKEEIVSGKTDNAQYSFNITVNGQVGFDNGASTKGGGSPTYKTGWENGDRIFLFFQPTDGILLDDRYATLTYDGSSWNGTVSSGQSSLGEGGTLSAVYVYNLDGSVTPEFSDNKWTIETGNVFYNCQTGVNYSVSDSEISATLDLVAPADFVCFTIYNANGRTLTCDKVNGWNDVVIGSEMTFSNATCTGYMTGNENIGNPMYWDYYGRIVGGESSLCDETCNFSVDVNGEVYEYTATPQSDARSFNMDANKWTPSGKLTGVFTVKAATGSEPAKQVRFSKGNLQATYSTTTSSYTWSFAANQYDFIGNAKGNTSIDTQTDGAVVDLFGWVGASSTLFTSEPQIYGISTSTTADDYGKNNSDALMADWGKNIDDKGTWRTLTKNEWEYLLNNRAVGARFVRAKVNGIDGIILLSDTYVHPSGVTAFDNLNISSSAYINNVNQYPLSDWEKIESAGAVFLPCAKTRSRSSVSSFGGYWTSTSYYTPTAKAYCLIILQSNHSISSVDRFTGYSVRLVTDVK